jgi:putative addiction module component (TIGR02574 family)
MSAIAIDHLTPQEKLDLIERLVDSLEPEDIPLPPGHREELERRLKTLEADITDGVLWEDMDISLRQRFG